MCLRKNKRILKVNSLRAKQNEQKKTNKNIEGFEEQDVFGWWRWGELQKGAQCAINVQRIQETGNNRRKGE